MKFCSIFLFFLSIHSVDAQQTTTDNELRWDLQKPLKNNNKNILIISKSSLYTVALIGLNELWYKKYPKSKFHFINDNGEWLQMDKFGHAMTSYYTGFAGIKAYKWAGFNDKESIWYGGMSGSLFLTIIEYLDGRSEKWGASSGDLIANTFGSFLVISQALVWNDQKILLKYSYFPSKWAKYNPEQLGASHLERALKDYNGQTYWISLNLKSLLNIDDINFPKWLNLAFGYSANAMVNAYESPASSYARNRQFLMSFDIDLNKIKTKNKLLNSVIHTFGFLKIPAPTLEFRKNSFYFNPVYY